MHPTFLFIPLPVVLCIWAVVALSVVAWSVYQAGWSADTWITLLMMAAAGAGLYWFIPRLGITDHGRVGLAIRGYGFFVAVGVLSAVALGCRLGQQLGFDRDTILTSAFYIVGCGIVGARLFYVIEYFDDFRRESASATVAAMLRFHEGGLVVYGGFIGAVVGFAAFVLRTKTPPLKLLDVYPSAMMVGLGFGRLGCLMNGCCWGGLCATAIAIAFPAGSPPYMRHLETGELLGARLEPLEGGHRWRVVRVDSGSAAAAKGVHVGDEIIGRRLLMAPDDLRRVVRESRKNNGSRPVLEWTTTDRRRLVWRVQDLPAESLPVHPAQLYASVNAFLLAGLLYFYVGYRRRPGDVFALLITLYPVSRFLLERIRSDEPGIAGTSFTISQWVSIVLLLTATAWWVSTRWIMARRRVV